MSMTNAEMLEIADRRGNEGDVDEAPFISLPQPPDGLFYGDIGVWSEQATRHSEASRVAVFASLMTYVGNVLGRNVCLYQGDTAHHSRLLFLHVGRTARGRKGTAIAPTERLHEALMRLDEVADRLACSNSSQPPEKTAPQLHMGGLSTREGLAYAIRDPSRKWDRDAGEWVEDDPGVPDKRLFVVESELDVVSYCPPIHGDGSSGSKRALLL
jgi:putative DNA primase/helicase